MKITISGATGLIGVRLVGALVARGDEVTVLSRSPEKAADRLKVDAVAWDPTTEKGPAAALEGRDAVIHLAGEPVAQRWSGSVKQAILESRELGTRNLVAGLAALDSGRPQVLVSSSAVGYYGPHGDEPVDESTPAGSDFLADVSVRWEREADAAAALGLRVVHIRTGIVLDKSGGALQKMLSPFKMGVGGPVAGGRQYMPWIHVDDLVAMYVRAVDDATWTGAYNGSAPTPVSNKVFSRALGKTLKRPAFSPVPKLALKLLYGEMADIVTTGVNAVPTRALAGGFVFAHPDLDEALRSALS